MTSDLVFRTFSSLLVVELLIVAHDCFSLTCNMEGIVRVLQAARHLSHAHLAPGEHFGLLVPPTHRQNNFLLFLSGDSCGLINFCVCR